MGSETNYSHLYIFQKSKFDNLSLTPFFAKGESLEAKLTLYKTSNLLLLIVFTYLLSVRAVKLSSLSRIKFHYLIIFI